MKSINFYSFSFGCRVNEAEREAMDRKLSKAGFVQNEANPNVIVINSCAVTAKAEREARQLIYQLRKIHPQAKIVATGCAVTYWLKNNLYKDLPIDLKVDNSQKQALVSLIKANLLESAQLNLANRKELGITSKFLDSGRVIAKIQDGCQRFCSYCIVPYLRGKPKSSKIKEIVDFSKEIKPMHELILTAINTEAFGLDSGENLVDLLRELMKKTDIPRISFGSINPWSLTPDFFKFYQENVPKGRLVNFFHIPLQSGSDQVLKLMKRDYTTKEFNNRLLQLYNINPFALIATDVIVGFLGETPELFEETYEFLKKSTISKFHVFRFSKRNNTAAFYLAKKLKEPSPEEKEKRAKALIELGAKKLQAFMKNNIGRKSKFLFLNKLENNYRLALLDNNLPIWIDMKGQFPTPGVVEIIGYKSGKLFGRII